MTSFRRDEPGRAAEAVPATTPEVVIDVAATDAVRKRLLGLSHPSKFPSAVPCPECGGPGDLDTIDLSADVREQRCAECGHSWTIDLRR